MSAEGESSDATAIDLRIADFRSALSVEPDDHAIVQRHLLHGACYAVPENVTFTIKDRIATNFGLNAVTDIYVVGSAKLGFSIRPSQRWKHFDDDSDIDVAIVSHDMYQTLWHELHDYHLSGADWPRRKDFVRYLAQGWLRPDFLPPSTMFSFGDGWWKFFNELKAEQLVGPRKINAGLYHDIAFLTKYQAAGVSACRDERTDDADKCN